MGIFSGLDKLVEGFSERFEAHGEDFLFRTDIKAAPVHVTAIERDQEVRRFRQSMQWTMIGFLVAILALLAGFIVTGIAFESSDRSLLIWLVVIPVTAMFA